MSDSEMIVHREHLPKYAPPGHSGTVNVRLVDRAFCKGFEMVLGRLAPGAVADRHHHECEHQAFYVLSGEAVVTLGEETPVRCGPGTTVRIPPGLDHHVVNEGKDDLELLIVYSPPLPPRDDTPVSRDRGV